MINVLDAHLYFLHTKADALVLSLSPTLLLLPRVLLCRVVLVSNYTQTLNLLQDLCTHLGYSCCRLDGQTPVSQRQKLVDRFNGQYSTDFIFLLSSKAGGVGLNLVGASHLILYDIDWNPANDIQVVGSHGSF